MLNRFLQKIFGINGPTGEFGQFGSDSAGSQVTTKDPDEIQALSAYYEQGLFPATNNHQEPPRIEDINGLYFLFTRQLAYLFQAGIAEWQTDTEYFADKSIVLASDGGIYIAITGTEATPNTGLEPSTHSDNWKLLITKSGVASGNPPLTRAINSGNGLSGGGDLSSNRTLSLDFEATATNIKMNGAQSVGATTKAARSDHVHPTDTSRAPTNHASSGTSYGVGTNKNYGHNKVINDLAHSAFANGESLSAYQGKVLNDSKAPNSHASAGATYGVGTTANYGHNKVINDLTHSAFANGESLSAYQGKVLNDSKAPNSHASAGATYGVGTTANYGHNKVINDLTHSTFANGESLSAYMGYLLQTNKQNNLNLGSGWATALKAILTASTAELNFCDGVTSSIQAQLNAKLGVTAYSVGATGYIRFSNGFRIEWGVTGSTTDKMSTTVTFPLSFSNANYSFNAQQYAGAEGDFSNGSNTKNAAGGSITLVNRTNGTCVFKWIAIGY